MAQKTGSMGENYFNYLCASENINCNKSEEDMAGWDYILDFPFHKDSASADTSKGPIECKVQIKSTTKDRKYAAVKLSNLLRFCKSSLPTFFLFIEFGSSKEPQDLYLVHFDNDLIRSSLTAIRKAEQGKKVKKLNTSSMRINYNDSHKLSSISGLDLKVRIESFIPNGMSEYSMNKIKFTESVGFESGSGVMKFKTTSESSLKDMIDAILGFEKEIEVSDITITESRFGIELASPLHKVEKATLKINSGENFLPVTVKFRENKYSPPIVFPAKIYILPIENLPAELTRVRLKTAFFDLMIGLGDKASTYQLTMGSEKHLLNDLYKQAKLLNWMCYEKQEILLDIQLEYKPETSVGFIITPTKEDIHSGVLEWKEEIENIKKISWIATKFEIENSLRVSISETYQNRESVSWFHSLYHYPVDKIKIDFSLEGDYREGDFNKKHTASYFFHFRLGGVLMVTILSLQGFPTKIDDDKYTLLVEDRIFEKELICHDDELEFKDYIKNEIILMNKKYQALGLITLNV